MQFKSIPHESYCNLLTFTWKDLRSTLLKLIEKQSYQFVFSSWRGTQKTNGIFLYCLSIKSCLTVLICFNLASWSPILNFCTWNKLVATQNNPNCWPQPLSVQRRSTCTLQESLLICRSVVANVSGWSQPCAVVRTATWVPMGKGVWYLISTVLPLECAEPTSTLPHCRLG